MQERKPSWRATYHDRLIEYMNAADWQVTVVSDPSLETSTAMDTEQMTKYEFERRVRIIAEAEQDGSYKWFTKGQWKYLKTKYSQDSQEIPTQASVSKALNGNRGYVYEVDAKAKSFFQKKSNEMSL